MSEILHVFGIDWRMLVVQLVNFSLLLGVLWYFLYRPLLAFIEKRQKEITEGVEKAERAEMTLREADSEKKEVIAQASREAEEILGHARVAGKSKEEVLLKLAQEKATRILGEAKDRSEMLKKQALDESQEEMARMVVLGVEKILRDKKA